MNIPVGERFSTTTVLTPASIAAFARASGDANPLHHDPSYARASPFRAIIASGPQTSALLMGATATHFSALGHMVGVEFSFRFRAPVFVGAVRLEWLIVASRYSTRLGGYWVDLRGRAVRPDGLTAVGAKGRVLVRSASER